MQSFKNFIALGDSLMSDDYPGQGGGAAALLYRNQDRLFPEFAGRDLVSACPGIQYRPLARTGFTSEDVLEESLGQLRSSREPTLVALTVGGNDLLECMADGLAPATALERLRRNLGRIAREVGRLFKHLTLRVGNVYDPTDGTGVVQSGHRRLGGGLSHLTALNEVLAGLAGGNLVDIYSHFRGHGGRHRDPSFEHYHPEDPTGWIMFDIEPNPRGASEVRRLFWRSLE